MVHVHLSQVQAVHSKRLPKKLHISGVYSAKLLSTHFTNALFTKQFNDPSVREQTAQVRQMSEYSAVRVGKLKLKGGKGTLGGKKRKRKRHHSKSEETGEGPLRHGIKREDNKLTCTSVCNSTSSCGKSIYLYRITVIILYTVSQIFWRCNYDNFISTVLKESMFKLPVYSLSLSVHVQAAGDRCQS